MKFDVVEEGIEIRKHAACFMLAQKAEGKRYSEASTDLCERLRGLIADVETGRFKEEVQKTSKVFEKFDTIIRRTME